MPLGNKCSWYEHRMSQEANMSNLVKMKMKNSVSKIIFFLSFLSYYISLLCIGI